MPARGRALAALAAALAMGVGSSAGALAEAPAARAHRLIAAAPGAAAPALERAGPGDTVLLRAGIHRGPLTLIAPVTLRGEPGAVVDGGGSGTVITVAVSGATVEDLEVRGSGRDVMNVDAALRIIRSSGVTVRRLRARDVLYGVYAERAESLVVESCGLSGRVGPGAGAKPRVGHDAEGLMAGEGEGNGIHLWNCAGARIAGNRVEAFQDAIYLSFTHRSTIERNLLEGNGRYGLHTMYCQRNHLAGNRFTRNVAGCAIMFSNQLEVRDNDFVLNRGSRTYGLLLRDCSDGDFLGNRMVGNTIAVFMDNSNRNRFRGNLVANNGWGLLLYSSCAGNEFAGNDFLGNDYPVALDMRRTDNRFDDGARGNYWEENPAYDLDGDGLSDVPYSPVGAFAFASKRYPDLTVLAKSPAVVALGVAERVMPALRPSEAVDRHPLVRPAGMSAAPIRPGGGPRAPRSAGLAAAFLALAGGGLAGLRFARARS